MRRPNLTRRPGLTTVLAVVVLLALAVLLSMWVYGWGIYGTEPPPLDRSITTIA